MNEVITKLDVGNYYGCLKVKSSGGKFFWCVEDWDGDGWEEISESLYNALIAYGPKYE